MLKSLDYYKLRRHLKKKAEKKRLPLKAMFELTYRCNLKCQHCYVVSQDKRNELSTKEVFSILDKLASAGCLNLGLTGGEPFLRDDIFDILGYAKRLGFIIAILTNGSLITPDKADRLKELGLNKIDISFHTTNKNTFDWFTQVLGSYQKVLNALKLLRERNIHVFFKTTAMTINKDDIVNLRHLAIEKFGAHFRLSPIVTPAWYDKKDNLRFRLGAEEIYCIKKELRDDAMIEFSKLDPLERKNRIVKNKGRKRKIDYNKIFHCDAGRTEVSINPYGEMKLCIDLHYPNYSLINGSFQEGWKTLQDYVKNTLPGKNYKCNSCKLSEYCIHCPARAQQECGDMNACPAYYRDYACLTKRRAEDKKAENKRKLKNDR